MKLNNSLVIRIVRLYHIGTADLHDFLENFLKMLQYHIDIWLHDHTLSIKCYSSRSGIAWTILSVCSFDTLVDKAKKNPCFQYVQACMGCGNRQSEKGGGRRKRTAVLVSLLFISSELQCRKDMWILADLSTLFMPSSRWTDFCGFVSRASEKFNCMALTKTPGPRGHTIAMFKNKITFIYNVL
jgi:hypothetical protein